jgi:aryl-alcohol dehydrogenase-like predicted oxidoreductase
MKIGLGTVQFGLDYGISSTGRKTTAKEIDRLLAFAYSQNIWVLDTAPAYGSSELALGNAGVGSNLWRVVTKTPHFQNNSISMGDVDYLQRAFNESLDRMQVDSVYGLLIHGAKDILKQGGGLIYKAVQDFKKQGKVKKIGVSIYSAAEVDNILDRFEIDIIQLPVNILDQRLIYGGQLKRLKEKGVEVHGRSIFLQGLLLLKPEEIHPYFLPIKDRLIQLHLMAKKIGLSPSGLALYFASIIKEIDISLVGFNSFGQLKSLLLETDNYDNLDLSMSDFRSLSLEQEKFLNPSLWDLSK